MIDKRELCQRQIARLLATEDGYTWQNHPSMPQLRRQDRYNKLAKLIITIVETNLKQGGTDD